MVFVEDFCEHFHIALSDDFDEDDFEIIGEMVAYLSEQVTRAQEKESAAERRHLKLVKDANIIAS